jgi:hypothetical protein
VLALINMSDREIPVTMPVPRFGPWTLAIDTSGASGATCHSLRTGPIVVTPSVAISPRSILVYESHHPS